MVRIRYTGDALWERIQRAVDKVKIRLQRVTAALDAAGIDYAVVGGNAVQLWVAQVDEAAVRNTRDVDILLERTSLPAAIEALSAIGFVYQVVADVPMFLDGPEATPRDAVHVVFAGEKVRADYPVAAPQVSEFARIQNLRTVSLEALVCMKLVSFRRKDQVHLLDMLDVGLIDASWLARVPEELRPRLQELIDNPEG